MNKPIRFEVLALLREIDALVQQDDGQPITMSDLSRHVTRPGGSLATDPMPHRTLIRRIQSLERSKSITIERAYTHKRKLDLESSYISITRNGIETAHPRPANPPGPVAPAPTWRGECIKAPIQTSTLDPLRRPPVMRHGSQDFRLCASRGA